jgi:hypothetical protein
MDLWIISLRNVAGFRVVQLVALALMLSVGCTATPSSTDREKLAILQQEYGQKFDFAFDGDLYLRAASSDTAAPSQSEIQSIYRRFMFDDSGARRRSTTFVYVNAYNARGEFLYQIAFDSTTKDFVISKREHY